MADPVAAASHAVAAGATEAATTFGAATATAVASGAAMAFAVVGGSGRAAAAPGFGAVVTTARLAEPSPVAEDSGVGMLEAVTSAAVAGEAAVGADTASVCESSAPSSAPLRKRLAVVPGKRDHLLSARQVSEQLGLCRASVYRLAETGELPSVRILNAIRFEPAAVAAFIAAKKKG